MTEFLKALNHAKKLRLQFISLPIAEAEKLATEIESLKATKIAAISGIEYRDNLLRQQRAEVAATLMELQAKFQRRKGEGAGTEWRAALGEAMAKLEATKCDNQ